MALSLRPASHILSSLSISGTKTLRVHGFRPHCASRLFSFQLRPKTNYQEFIRHRSAAVEEKPKITTHYSIHPRDKDSRWEDIDMTRSGKSNFVVGVVAVGIIDVGFVVVDVIALLPFVCHALFAAGQGQ